MTGCSRTVRMRTPNLNKIPRWLNRARYSASPRPHRLWMARRRRHSLELQLLKSAVRRGDVNVSFRVGRHMVAASQHARAADGLHNIERLAIEHYDFPAASDVQELLFWVGRQCQVACEGRISFDPLLDELAIR